MTSHLDFVCYLDRLKKHISLIQRTKGNLSLTVTLTLTDLGRPRNYLSHTVLKTWEQVTT